MVFNHYAKLKTILELQPKGWYIVRIDEPTTSKSFGGETKTYDHYYRLYDHNKQLIKYGKFQQLDRLSSILNIPVTDLPVIE